MLAVGATVSISWKIASIGPLDPMMFENWCVLCNARFSRTFSCWSRFRSSSLRTRIRSSFAAPGDLLT